LEIVKKGGRVLGIDMDQQMLEVAEDRLRKARRAMRPSGPEACPVPKGIFGDPFILIQGNFKDIETIAKERDFSQVDGIIFDLGVSNLHLTSPLMGFSFANPDAELDMRLDLNSQGVKAKDLLNALNVGQLTELFSETLDLGLARAVARKVIAAREVKPFEKVCDLLGICRFLPKKGRLHPATKVFLALRIAVNSELENLKEALPKAYSLLRPGGRLVVISFHSGEEKIVKGFVSNTTNARIVTEKPIVPGINEVTRNPRARSAKMRVLQKNI